VLSRNLYKVHHARCRHISIFSHNLNKKRTLDDLFNEDKDDEKKEEPDKRKRIIRDEKPVSVKLRVSIVSTVLAILGCVWYYLKNQKEELELIQREEECSKTDIGSVDFTLTDHTGKRVSKKDFIGKWLILYFGFTHCPDICPEELERITDIVTMINESKEVGDLQPVFMSVDPRRDSPEAVAQYLKDFHPTFVGLTGTEEEIKTATKSFRVYYSLGPKDNDDDYIVDHSIIMYLMDPRGQFVDYYGSRGTAVEEIAAGITKRMKNYKRLHG